LWLSFTLDSGHPRPLLHALIVLAVRLSVVMGVFEGKWVWNHNRTS